MPNTIKRWKKKIAKRTRNAMKKIELALKLEAADCYEWIMQIDDLSIMGFLNETFKHVFV